MQKYALSYQGEWWWVPVGPIAGPMSDVARLPGTDIYAAITRAGEVWVSADGARAWELVLIGVLDAGGDATRPALGGRLGSAQDDLLSNVDVEAVGDFEAYDDGGVLEDNDALIQQAVDNFNEEQDDVEALQRAIESGDREAGRPRVWFDGTTLFAARLDGLYRTEDLGAVWERVLSRPVGAFVRTRRGLVVGTDDGMRYSGDGVVWFDQDDGSEGVDVLDLTARADAIGIWAATRQGLWATDDGAFWTQRNVFDEPVLHVAPDPDVEGRIWVSLPSTILSSDDGGITFDEPLTAPMPAVTEMLRLGPLHWVAVSADGPWETMNGGLSWVPITRGLLEPDTTGLEAVDGTLVLASIEGILRMERAPDLVYDPEAQAQLVKEELDAWIPRGDLVGSALGREQLNLRAGGPRILAYMIPQVTTIFEHRNIDGLDFSSGLGQDDLEDFDITRGGETLREYDRFWRFSVSLRWAPPSKARTLFGSNAVLDAYEAQAGVAFGGGIDQGTGGPAGREATAYRTDLARRVNELYNARADALQRRVEVARAPLLQQVQLELYIAEIEGELDALTDGAVSSFDTPTTVQSGATP